MTTLDEDIKALKEKINELNIDLENVLGMKVPQRIICKLVKIAHKVGAAHGAFKLPFTKGTLALQVGIEQETLSRALPKLHSYGVTVVEKTVSFFDAGRMEKMVCGTCAGCDSCRAFQAFKQRAGVSPSP